LIELVGEPVAKEILLAGRVLSAEECLGLRLLNRVVATEDLEAAAEELREKICDQGALAVQLTKRAIHAPRAAHPLVEELSQAILFETEEKERRMTAFLERRR
jgi:enoyl-CoA hydratase